MGIHLSCKFKGGKRSNFVFGVGRTFWEVCSIIL